MRHDLARDASRRDKEPKEALGSHLNDSETSHPLYVFLNLIAFPWQIIHQWDHFCCVPTRKDHTFVHPIKTQLDLLQDELRAWWCTGSKDGSKVLPLAADLRAKVKKKKELGF